MKEEDFKVSISDPYYWVEMKRLGLTALKSERRVGKPKLFTAPEHLWAVACDYFHDTSMNPYQREEFIRGGPNAGTKVFINVPRPFTWPGFERFCIQKGIIVSLSAYRNNRDEAYNEFIPIIDKIDMIMREQKFEGASMNIFNASIISKDLGLAEVTENRLSISQKDDIDYSRLSDEALEEITQQFEENRLEEEKNKR